MKIRSITCFCNPSAAEFNDILKSFTDLTSFCRLEFEKIGWEVQTIRLATVPFGQYSNADTIVRKAVQLEEQAASAGFTYISLGPARISQPDEYAIIPEILSATRSVFASGIMNHYRRGISVPALRACARIIQQAAVITPDGFANLRFCAMSNVNPFTPFFPAAYSYGSEPAFSLAIQAADAAVSAFEKAGDAEDGCLKLIFALEAAANELKSIAKKAEWRFGAAFKGFDFSLAPFPEEWCSLGKAFEKLGVPALGDMGSLTAAALLAGALDRGSWQRTGFNGLMMPVLEDSTLAARSGSSRFTIKDLLMYSAMCGTGLDTVPLPGDLTAEMIEPLLMDLCALSLRLHKPLTARLMPVPGLKAGDKTSFDFDYFKNGTIMDYPVGTLSGVLASSQWLDIRRREIAV